jgi:uncharacterized membrane protein
MTTKTEITAATLATALALLASAASAGPVPPQPTMDKCYGVAMKGHNDCAAGAGTRWITSAMAGNMSPKALVRPSSPRKATAV